MKYNKIIIQAFIFIILGYFVGLLIKFTNPFNSSDNAPFMCAIGSVSFFIMKNLSKKSLSKIK